MNRLRIGLVAQPWTTIEPPSDSIAIWIREVARRLADRCDVTVYSAGDPEQSRIEGGVSHRFLDTRWDWRLRNRVERVSARVLPARRPFFATTAFFGCYWRAIAHSAARRRLDVVHVANFSQLAPLVRRADPRIATVVRMGCDWLSQLGAGLVERRLRSIDLVLGCSEHVTRGIQARFPDHAGRCATLHNGVDLERFQRADPSEEPPRLLYVGRISPEKGVHVLLRAMAPLVDRHPRLTLELVGGDGVASRQMLADLSDEPQVRALAPLAGRDYPARVRSEMSAGVREAAHFTGELPHAELAERYRRSSLVVQPSLSEAFGTPVCEAMAAGLPVVGSRVGGIPELVDDGSTGLLVAPGDERALAGAIERLVESPERRRSMGRAGRDRAVERFSLDRIADAALAHYERVARR